MTNAGTSAEPAGDRPPAASLDSRGCDPPARDEDGAVAVAFLKLINESRTLRELIAGVASFFQRHSGCEAIGIRLQEGDDYPYYEAHGFPSEFVVLENSLCVRDASGSVTRSVSGYPLLECMCGNVICGRFDASKPFFTPNGSFWSNCTTELLATTTEADRQERTRNRCNGEGYESVALIPLISGEARLGLLQVNDRRTNRFTPESIARWERLAGYLAVAVAKLRAEQALKELNAELERRIDARTAELQEANRELESFAYSVSHDLRAPLRSINGFTNVLLEESGAALDAAGRDNLNRVLAAAARMERLIDDLLGLSRITRAELKHETVDLSSLGRSVLRGLQRSDPARRAEVVVVDGMHAVGDPGLLLIVVENVLGNAWKFTSKKPEARIFFGVEEVGGVRACVVRDNGAGFDPQYAGRLFGVFQRLHGEAEFRGTGIGLATVARILARHGGRIWADAAPGRGATFFFTLPGL